MKGRLIALMLALLLALPLLTGCGGWEDPEDPIPLGRYVEAEIELPPEANLIGFQRDSAGELQVLFLQHESSGARYVLHALRDGRWTPDEPDWLAAFPPPDYQENAYETIDGFAPCADGSAYALVTQVDRSGGGYAFTRHLYRAADGQRQDITPASWQGSDVLPGGLQVADQGAGCFVLLTNLGVVHYGEDGTELATYPGNHCFSLSGQCLYVMESGYTSLLRYRLGAAEPEKLAYPNGEAVRDRWNGAVIVPDQDGVLVADPKGIHRYINDSKSGETIVDGALNTMNMPSATFQGMGVDRDGVPYIYYAPDRGATAWTLVRYDFQPDTPAYPSKELVLYSYEDHMVVRQAISAFQRQNPDYRITLRIGTEEIGVGDAATREDAIQALNAELLSGQGPDILILDGLPVESYLENGVLMDLTQALGELAEPGALKEAALAPYRVKNSLYAVPARFQLPLYFGKGLGADASLADIATAAAAYTQAQAAGDKPEDLPFMRPTSFRGRVQMFYHANLSRWLPADGQPDPGELTAFLEEVQTISQASQDQAAQERYDDIVYDAMGLNQGLDLNAYAAAAEERQQANPLFAELSVGVQAFAAEGGYFLGLQGMDAATMNHTFLPAVIAGVRASSPEKEQAGAFIKLLLSEKVQAPELEDGHAVNQAALETRLNKLGEQTGTLLGVSNENASYRLNLPDLTAAQLSHLTGVLNNATEPALTDQSVLEIVLDEAERYLQGKISAEAATDAILARVQTYLDE